jgi:hypothetical protein
MRLIIIAAIAAATSTPGVSGRDAVAYWSHEARQAIVPAGPNGVFGPENYGDKFPGEAAIYLGIVHAAIYDAVVAIDGGYEPYAVAATAARGASADAAVATAAHHVLVGILGPAQQSVLNGRYESYLQAIPDTAAKTQGVAIGERVAAGILALRTDDGRERNPVLGDLSPPPPGAGVWDPGAIPAVGLRVPGIRPLVLEKAWQFRPDGPTPLTSADYADDFAQVAALGRADSLVRRDDQTTQALFWTDHDLRQWNDGLLALAAARGLNRVRTARMLAMAHVAGGDAMIACFDAKYTYWFWRPYQAIPRAGEDGNGTTTADPGWHPLRATPNFPEEPSAHACHCSALAHALLAFFGTDRIAFSLDSRITGTTRVYRRFREVIADVDRARVLVGFHFRTSDQEGAALGRQVARYMAAHRFRPLG